MTAARQGFPAGRQFFGRGQPLPGKACPGRAGKGGEKAESTLQGKKNCRKIEKSPCKDPKILLYYISRLA